MKAAPLKGMKDCLPREMQIRDYVQSKILKVYRDSGFERIATPILEDIENLNQSEGGDNLNLIFKVLKRGEKLEKALTSQQEQALADMGLRYDLTLPLARFYAANHAQLPTPFKVIQTDRVYRAERPQKGRSREFIQCDIDILGDDSIHAEIELMEITARALLAVGFQDFTIHVNDRRLLRGMLAGFGFSKEMLESVCITFDKLDKIGIEGVVQELQEKDCPQNAITALKDFLDEGDYSLERVTSFCEDQEAAQAMQQVMKQMEILSNGAYQVSFQPSLVRGQGYYTGVVFEVTCPAFSGAIAGGGRYDGMIGKFLGKDVPAVGFSIGFERICAILYEQNFQIPEQSSRLALLYQKEDDFTQVLMQAQALRENYQVTVLLAAKKLGKQLNQLEQRGFTHVCYSQQYPTVKEMAKQEMTKENS